jgi:hypothetical protein
MLDPPNFRDAKHTGVYIDVEPALAACFDPEAELLTPPLLGALQVLDRNVDVTKSKDNHERTSLAVKGDGDDVFVGADQVGQIADRTARVATQLPAQLATVADGIGARQPGAGGEQLVERRGGIGSTQAAFFGNDPGLPRKRRGDQQFATWNTESRLRRTRCSGADSQCIKDIE